MASKIEPLIVETLYDLAGDPARESLRTLLQMNRADWDRTASAEQRRILGSALEVVRYDHREKQVSVRLKSKHPGDSLNEISVGLRARLFEPPRSGLRGPRTPERPASVARLLALAHRLDGLMRDGIVANYTELAQYASVTRARISQIMNLLNLAPIIQEQLLFLPTTESILITERSLRYLASVTSWDQQSLLFEKLPIRS
jgi:hypothetical protein